MTSNPESIVPQVQHEFQNLLAYVTGPDARSQTAYTVELTLFRRLLALGATLLRLFWVTRAAGRARHRPSGRSWWCKRTAKACRWGSRLPRRRPCAWARGQSAPCSRRPSSQASTPSPRTSVAPRRWWPPCCRTPAVRRRRQRPRPVGKELRATLAGKAAAMRGLAQRVAQPDGPHLQPRVALTEGAEARPPPVVPHVPAYTVILDSIHATESRGDTANALLGETHPPRPAWGRAYLEALLAGQSDAVIMVLEAEGKDPTCTLTPRQAVRRTVGYDRRNRPYLRDDEDRAHGWPMGTGVVEGACRHLVNDRREPAGMRWTTGGAQGGLNLRAVRLNGHWARDWQFHRHHPHQRLYGHSTAAPALAETRALEWAA